MTTDSDRILKLAEIIREVDGNHRLGAAALAEAILSHPGSRWSPAIKPVPVSERLPGPEDCDAEGRCWWWDDDDDKWCLHEHSPRLLCWTHWRPHYALPVPTTTETP